MINRIALAFLFLSLAVSARAQTIDDGIMVAGHSLFTGDIYGHESWDHYWEGTLKRENGNVGTVTTKTNVWYVARAGSDGMGAAGGSPALWATPPGRAAVRGDIP